MQSAANETRFHPSPSRASLLAAASVSGDVTPASGAGTDTDPDGNALTVVGVAAGGVTLLDKTAPQAPIAAESPALPPFAAWLQRAMKARQR